MESRYTIFIYPFSTTMYGFLVQVDKEKEWRLWKDKDSWQHAVRARSSSPSFYILCISEMLLTWI
jgi:hypothetical protein